MDKNIKMKRKALRTVRRIPFLLMIIFLYNKASANMATEKAKKVLLNLIVKAVAAVTTIKIVKVTLD